MNYAYISIVVLLCLTYVVIACITHGLLLRYSIIVRTNDPRVDAEIDALFLCAIWPLIPPILLVMLMCHLGSKLSSWVQSVGSKSPPASAASPVTIPTAVAYPSHEGPLTDLNTLKRRLGLTRPANRSSSKDIK